MYPPPHIISHALASLPRTHAHSQAHKQAHTHTLTHAQQNEHTHTHAHTHTHTGDTTYRADTVYTKCQSVKHLSAKVTSPGGTAKVTSPGGTDLDRIADARSGNKIGSKVQIRANSSSNKTAETPGNPISVTSSTHSVTSSSKVAGTSSGKTEDGGDGNSNSPTVAASSQTVTTRISSWLSPASWQVVRAK
jgi:hypothetical protein